MPQMMIGIGQSEKQKLKIRVSATMNINQSKLKSTAHFATVFVKISWYSEYLLQSIFLQLFANQWPQRHPAIKAKEKT